MIICIDLDRSPHALMAVAQDWQAKGGRKCVVCKRLACAVLGWRLVDVTPSNTPRHAAHVGAVLLQLMEEAGVNRTQVARATKITRNTIGNLLNGASSPQPTTVRKVCGFLSEKLGYIVDEDLLDERLQKLREREARLAANGNGHDRRDDDSNPAMKLAKDITDGLARLPRHVQFTILNLIMWLEEAHKTRDDQ
jgi:transcriptional regulator with XRE-family HTH domain